MANRIIFTTPFRVNFPHLDKPHAQAGSTETPKYSVGALFPKSGLMPAHVANGVVSSNESILTALDEVCMEAFGVTYQASNLTFTQGHTMASFPAPWTEQMIIDQGYAVKGAGIGNNAAMLGVTFPPPLVDGDTDFKSEKNAQGVNLKTTIPHESSVGMWKMGFKNVLPVQCCDPTGQHLIDPLSIYSGCWAVAELEVTAYVGGKGNVIAIKLLNIQMAFNDERVGGGAHIPQAATTSFANRAIVNSNVEAGYGQTAAMAVTTGCTCNGCSTGCTCNGCSTGCTCNGCSTGCTCNGCSTGCTCNGCSTGCTCNGCSTGCTCNGCSTGCTCNGCSTGCTCNGCSTGCFIP